MLARHVSDLIGPPSGVFYKLYLQIWHVVIRVLLDTFSHYEVTAKGGTTWARSGRWFLPENARLPHNIQGSFTCRKSTTSDRRLYFPSEGRRAEDFFSPWKIQLANLGTKGQHATSRTPKPLTFIVTYWIRVYNEDIITHYCIVRNRTFYITAFFQSYLALIFDLNSQIFV